jgi:hypothetical protein
MLSFPNISFDIFSISSAAINWFPHKYFAINFAFIIQCKCTIKGLGNTACYNPSWSNLELNQGKEHCPV